jgi:hypothetical protein
MPARRRRFAVDTPRLPVFNHAVTDSDKVILVRKLEAMSAAYDCIKPLGQRRLRINQQAPAAITFRGRGWGLNMTAELSHKGKGLPNPHSGSKR